MLIGTQDFEYVLDNEFFKNIEGEDVQKGKVKRIIKAPVKKKILKRKTILQRKKYQQSRQIQNKNRTKQNSFRM